MGRWSAAHSVGDQNVPLDPLHPIDALRPGWQRGDEALAIAVFGLAFAHDVAGCVALS